MTEGWPAKKVNLAGRKILEEGEGTEYKSGAWR